MHMGLILKRSQSIVKIDGVPVANFTEVYRHKAADDPVYIKRLTWYVIIVANGHFMWKSYMQFEIALFTMDT